jgi:hypothetical protein
MPAGIARSHRELLALERLGQRTYTEFSMPRSNSFEPVGPIELGIWRVDARHDEAEASVMVDQRRLDIKRIALNQRVDITMDHGRTIELVLNRINKNQVGGYVSEPKETSWQMARTGRSGIVNTP